MTCSWFPSLFQGIDLIRQQAQRLVALPIWVHVLPVMKLPLLVFLFPCFWSFLAINLSDCLAFGGCQWLQRLCYSMNWITAGQTGMIEHCTISSHAWIEQNIFFWYFRPEEKRYSKRIQNTKSSGLWPRNRMQNWMQKVSNVWNLRGHS